MVKSRFSSEFGVTKGINYARLLFFSPSKCRSNQNLKRLSRLLKSQRRRISSPTRPIAFLRDRYAQLRGCSKRELTERYTDHLGVSRNCCLWPPCDSGCHHHSDSFAIHIGPFQCRINYLVVACRSVVMVYISELCLIVFSKPMLSLGLSSSQFLVVSVIFLVENIPFL